MLTADAPISCIYPAIHRQSILLVEDERTARRALSALLASAGYQIRAARSGEEALQMLRSDEPLPTVALVDFNLPGIDGLELISRLRQIDSGVFAVLITAADSASLRWQVEKDRLEYLRKPIVFEHLLQLIEHHFPPA